MDTPWQTRTIWTAAGACLGFLASAVLAMPWLEPLPDYVVNAVAGVCTAPQRTDQADPGVGVPGHDGRHQYRAQG
ncbi:hypothetical protein K4L06_16950 [Lysobacter sp. BMK333-48F3]|uniref:hypothetical protein n=1 Tax=Lysobacter sp. BMK333-48F3 TaxID=2867962 RepID=UPI001C8BF982|nr:hypothetical protein [Lysobacter sp. BMK333-48F3]MBX9402999.1 hypothetical protein [Lysobacter sp. BMK333-48F3]